MKPQMIIGGPPCQDFSSAGKRDETLGRADLTISYANIVASSKPEWFVMENVERIIKSRILKEAIQIFKKAGYGISYQVLDASFCGVPQSRKRFFLIGHRYSPDNFLNSYLAKNLSSKPMTLFDYFGNSFGIEYYYRHPRSYARRGVFSIYEPSPTIRRVILKPNWFCIKKKIKSLKIKIINQENPENHFNLGITDLFQKLTQNTKATLLKFLTK
jgi:DNA (cytosine-5)-methyltransferase 1